MDEGRESACYVYGIVPAGSTAPEGLTGLGDPPAPVALLPEGDVAAVVSEIPVAAPIGSPRDLRSHARVLDTLAAGGTPVLPLRFGAVLSDDSAVTQELLAPEADRFRGALDELEGWVQFTVRGSYRSDRLLREVLESRPDIAELREATRGLSEQSGRQELLRLGEMVAGAVADVRAEDARLLLERLSPHAGTYREGTVNAGDEAVNTAFLVRLADRTRFEGAVEQLARHWSDRIELRLLGPLAPYDFATEVVETAGPAGAAGKAR